MASLPLGLTSPVSRFASASAPRIPGYHASITPAILSIQGMVAGLPVSRTTIVFALADATVSISLS